MNYTEALNDLRSEADAIVSHGGTVTDRFTTISDRWTAMRSTTINHTAQLAQAITGPTDPDPDVLAHTLQAATTAAVIGTEQAHQSDVLRAVAAHVLPEMRAEWNKTITTNYNTARDAYNTAASKLLKAIETVGDDPDARAENLMAANTKVRTAWAEIPMLAAEVDAAAAFLILAARHAGMRHDDAHTLGVTAVIPEDVDRRTLWDALDGDHGRAGKWGTLHAYGATLTAPETPEAIAPYRRPKPLEIRYLPGNLRGSHRQVEYDPETGKPEGAYIARGRMTA